MQQEEVSRFRGLDRAQATEKIAEEIAQCKDPKEQQRLFTEGNRDLDIQYGKVTKIPSLDVTMLVQALAKRGVDYRKFKLTPNVGIIRETDEISL